MKHAICFFTGTGNTYYVALKIQERFQDASLFFIPETDPMDLAGYDQIGIVSPVYIAGLPEIVSQFVERLAFKDSVRVYAIFTCGGDEGIAPSLMRQALRKTGKTLSYWNFVQMPDNYLLAFKVDPEECKMVLEKAEEKIPVILEELAMEKTTIHRPHFWNILKGLQKWVAKFPKHTASHYVVKGCIGCLKCVKSCPTNNIVYEEKTIRFQNRCTGCLGCLNICPVQAINYKKITNGKLRYMNPFVDTSKAKKTKG